MYSFNCPNCEASDIVKRGKRHNQSGIKQIYRCNECRKAFVEPDGFERMRNKKELIVRAIHQHQELKGKTPAEAAEIFIPLKRNKLLSLIKRVRLNHITIR